MGLLKQYLAYCSCGKVELAAQGHPIAANVCYCADCQEAGRQFAALASSRNVAELDGGTQFLLFRKDRFTCLKGAEHLRAHRLQDTSATRRMVASCCDSAMYMAFDDARHWVSAYRTRFVGDVPPLEMRICTKSRTSLEALDSHLPSYASYPPRLIMRLLGARLSMVFAPKTQNQPI